MVLWYISGAHETPNGSRRDQYLPNGVLNVQNFELSSSSFNCQNRWVQSIFEKYFPPDIFAIISSRVGSLKCSLRISLLKFHRSKQTRSDPSCLYTKCKEFTQSVFSSILVITSFSSILFQLFKHPKWYFSARFYYRFCIWFELDSPGTHPSPLNKSSYSSTISGTFLSTACSTASTLLTSPMSSHICLPNIG